MQGYPEDSGKGQTKTDSSRGDRREGLSVNPSSILLAGDLLDEEKAGNPCKIIRKITENDANNI